MTTFTPTGAGVYTFESDPNKAKLKKGDKKNLKEEAADVIFHLFVMLSSRGVTFEDVLGELERREGKSGIVEKQERKKKSK